MCVMSMVMEHYLDKWQQPRPTFDQPFPFMPMPAPNMPTKEEIAEFHRLLERARKYDVDHNEPDCEMEAKKQLLLKLAKEWGVELHLAGPAPSNK